MLAPLFARAVPISKDFPALFSPINHFCSAATDDSLTIFLRKSYKQLFRICGPSPFRTDATCMQIAQSSINRHGPDNPHLRPNTSVWKYVLHKAKNLTFKPDNSIWTNWTGRIMVCFVVSFKRCCFYKQRMRRKRDIWRHVFYIFLKGNRSLMVTSVHTTFPFHHSPDTIWDKAVGLAVMYCFAIFGVSVEESRKRNDLFCSKNAVATEIVAW